MNSVVEGLANFGLNLAIVIAIVRFIYYPQQRDKNYVFTFFAFNTVVFFVMGMLNNSEVGVGVGFVCLPSSLSCAIARIPSQFER